MNRNPVIIALDVESSEQARGIVSALGPSASFYKVGLELYAAAGMSFVDELLGAGKEVFLDLKFYDIGEQVKRAVAAVARRGVRFLTVHAASSSVMRAAVEGKQSSSLQLLGVTVLTSFDQSDIADLGYSCSPEELVQMRARKAVAAGVDGLVCSPVEVAAVRALVGPAKILVTPGVRSAGSAAGDQKRVATPAQAMRDGADYLVIGRQVTRAEDPRRMMEQILEEIG